MDVYGDERLTVLIKHQLNGFTMLGGRAIKATFNRLRSLRLLRNCKTDSITKKEKEMNH